MVFSSKQGTFTVTTGTGNQTVSGIGFTPKALIIWGTLQTVAGKTDACQFSMGFTDGTNQHCGGFVCDDAETASDTRRWNQTDMLIRLQDEATTTTAVFEAVIVSFASGEFTINKTVNTGDVRAILHYLALGGDLSNAAVGNLTLNTGTGNQSVTGLSFQPDCYILLSGYTTTSGVSTSAGLDIGVAVSTSKRGAVSIASEDNRPTMDTWRYQRNNAVFSSISKGTGAVDVIADHVSMNSDGFTFNISDAGPAVIVGYLALKGGQYDIVEFAIASGTGNQDVTTAFDPKGGLLFSNQSASTNPVAEEAHCTLCVGGWDGTDEGCSSISDEDNTADSETAQSLSTTKGILFLATDVNATGSSTATDLDGDITNGTNKFTINKTTNTDAQLGRVIALVFGDTPVGGATWPGWYQSRGGWF